MKGGGVYVDAGRWKSEDRHGIVHEIKNPFQQAVASKTALHRFVQDRLGYFVPTCHAVWLPDLWTLPTLGPDAPEAIVLGASHLVDASSALRGVVAHWRLSATLTARQVRSLAASLAPTVQVRRTLSDLAHDAQVRLLDLTTEQVRAFDMTRRHRRVVAFGGAGTGKTVLACEKARQLHASGRRVLLTCYNRLLGESLRNDPSLNGVTIHTFHSLCMSLARQAKLEVPVPIEDEWWEKDAPYLLVEAAESAGVRFDAVIVDEAQDFSKLWNRFDRCALRQRLGHPFLHSGGRGPEAVAAGLGTSRRLHDH